MNLLGGESVLQDGVMIAVLLSALPLGAAVVVGLVSSILQAATQIQEQTLSFVPKLCAVVFVLWCCGPWMWSQVRELLFEALRGEPLVF